MLIAILSQLNVVSVLAATLAGWIVGSLWHWVLGNRYAELLQRPARRSASAMVVSFIAELVMATMLFGIVHHIGAVSVERALFSAVMVWIGFVATTITVNNRLARDPFARAIIDGAHWLIVLLVMGAVIGAFGD